MSIKELRQPLTTKQAAKAAAAVTAKAPKSEPSTDEPEASENS